MKKPEDCNNMMDVREAIDLIDHQIVELISERAKYVKRAARFKTSESAVRDEERVRQVINSKKELAEKYGVSTELIGTIYQVMIDFFINEEMKEWKEKDSLILKKPSRF